MSKTFDKIWLILALICNGAAIMVIEILGTRIVAPYFGTTLYVWTALIVVTLLVLAVGYFLGGRLADKRPDWKIFYSLFFIAGIVFLLVPLVDSAILDSMSGLGIMWGPLVAALLLFFLPLGVLGMITPFAVRLQTKDVNVVGKTVGNFYALSTSGSIIGALVVAYILIPNVTISTIIYGSAIKLFLVGMLWFVIHRKGAIPIVTVLVIGVAAMLLQPAEKAGANVLEEVKSFYGDIKVETRSTDLTCITVNSIPQSCFNPDTDGSTWGYTALMTRGLEQVEDPTKVLVIGDGGGLISREILKKYDVEIDAVDVVAKMFELGKKYLHFEDSSNVNKIVADGRKFLYDSAGGYDSILIDAFMDSTPVLHLYSKEMFELAGEKMTANGVLAINLYGYNNGEGTETVASVYRTLVSVFDDVYVSPAGNAEQEQRVLYNFVLFASNSKLDRIGRVFEPEITDSTPIITDNYNPLEYYSLPASEELIKYFVFGLDE